MKVTDLFEEPNEWENVPPGSRQQELAFLERRRAALDHRSYVLKARIQRTQERTHINHPEVLRLRDELQKTWRATTMCLDGIRRLVVTGNHYCFTGFRSKELETKIRALGGHIDSSVTRSTDYLVVLDPNKKSRKILDAYDRGTELITREQLEHILRD